MAFSNSASDRMDEFRFRTQQSPRNESPLPLSGLTSPIRNGRLPPPPLTTHDGGRVSLTRRFTTDSGRVPTITSISSQRGMQAPESLEFPPSTTYQKVQLLEKKREEYNRLREQRLIFESKMQLLDLQQRREEQELQQMQEELVRTASNNTSKTQNGHQSEPSTPPEYRETSSGFPSLFSRPNRYSTSSITSPPGIYNRPGRSGSQLGSPQSGILPSRHIMDEVFSPHSGPGSRRGSDDDDKQEAVRQDPTSYRSSNTSNRYSMPVTKSRNPIQDLMDHDLDQTNTAEFLFGDEEPRSAIDSYLEKNSTKDHFPILVNRNGMNLSASHLALDLAIDPSASPEPQSYSFAPNTTRHRPSHSTSHANLRQLQELMNAHGSSTSRPGNQSTPTANHQNGRSTYGRTSLDMGYLNEDKDALASMTSPKHISSTPPKLQSSYSANDVPTMKNGSGDARNYSLANITSPNSHAQQYLHQHNASTGRYPTNGVNNRHSRELSGGDAAALRESQGNGLPSIQSALHASAPSFNIQQPRPQQPQSPSNMVSNNGYVPYGSAPYMPAYDGYNMQNMQMLTGAMQTMQMTPIPDMRMPQAGYNAPPGYNNSHLYGYNNMFQPGAMPHHDQNNGYGRGHDIQPRVIDRRRNQDTEKNMAQFKGKTMQNIRGQILDHCRDQYGCRFLQSFIDHPNFKPEDVFAIWEETYESVVELMMDPFGNYLCQKLFELCQNPQRTMMIKRAAIPATNMNSIAKNQHGTRALQKMIEFAQTPEQINLIIEALRSRVVELIEDTNGNHVIQKCLTKFKPSDSQFIFDSVAKDCVVVGTHKHGCCVLQRCIDHARDEQKYNLIRAITNSSHHLVKNPFGNYVIQYILDLNEDIYTAAMVMTFKDKILMLSVDKFGSNVIEKCIRTASEASKKMILDELTNETILKECVADQFANYVVQTALDYTEGDMRERLVVTLRPLVSHIRNLPCSRRISSRMEGDPRKGALCTRTSHRISPNEVGQIPLLRLQQHQRDGSNPTSYHGGKGSHGSNGFERNAAQSIRQNGNGYTSQQNGNNGHGPPEQAPPFRGGVFGAPPPGENYF